MKRFKPQKSGAFEPPFPVYGRTGGQFVTKHNKTPLRAGAKLTKQPAKPAIRKSTRPQLAAVLDVWSGREIWRTGLNEYWLSRGDGTLLRLSGLLEAQELAREHGVNLL